jgi:hypothetical protein
MRETIRVTCMLIVAGSIFAAALAWGNDRPTISTWIWRIGGVMLGLAGLAGFLIAHFQKDEVPDYLFERLGTYFECNGFCFMGRAIEYDRKCYLEVYFQNQQDMPSVGSIALQPSLGFFLTRANLDPIRLEIQCAPAAFGVARLAIPVPAEFQGTLQSFEVGATVEYPMGKGDTVRFRDGIVVRKNADLFNAVGTALTVAGAMTGQLILTKPATLSLHFPKNVQAELPPGTKSEVITLWKLGDKPLANLKS